MIEEIHPVAETDWFKALTFEAFKKYDFEWNHKHTQEENCKAFLEAVEAYGYDNRRSDSY